MKDSLLARLLWRLTLVSALLALMITLIVVIQFRSTADSLRDRNLSQQANDVARHLLAGEDGKISLNLPEPLRLEYAHSKGMYVYQVLDSDNRPVFSSGGSSEPLYANAEARTGVIDFFETDLPVEGEALPFYGASLAVWRNSRLFFVQVAQGPFHGDALVDEFLVELWEQAGWVVMLAFVVVVGVIYVTVRASLAPVATAAREAAAIGPQTLERRIAATAVPTEVRPLVAAFNNALDRIGDSYRKQREFTANAAHELRTPIAVLRAHVDTFEDRSVARALNEDIARLDRLVGQLLRLAQMDDLRIPKDCVAELNAIALETVALMGPGAIAEGKSIAVDEASGPVTVFGEEGAIGIALRNLIENALRVTPRGGTVEVCVDPAGAVAVVDRGPGIPPEIRERIFDRFWRDETSGEGAGLGMSIVRRIVDAHGGRIDIADAPGGGACVTLRFVI